MFIEIEMLNLMEKDSVRKGIESSPCANTKCGSGSAHAQSRRRYFFAYAIYQHSLISYASKSIIFRIPDFRHLTTLSADKYGTETQMDRLPPHPDHVPQASRFTVNLTLKETSVAVKQPLRVV